MRSTGNKEKERGGSVNINRTEFIAVTSGDNDGEIDLTWEPVRGANTYVVQKSAGKKEGYRWENIDVIDKSSYTVSKLKSKKEYNFRIAAVTLKGQGPWSEIVTKKAP
jgi:hypothetical protein